jgi:hypothetical protein
VGWFTCPEARLGDKLEVTAYSSAQGSYLVKGDESLAAQYSYQRAYLPVNRLEDGTMTNW